MRFLFLLSLSFLAVAQDLTLTAPWLVVYDPEGRPRWEIRVEKLWRTEEGWEGEDVSVILFQEGKPSIKAEAKRIRAESLGRSWTLSEGLEGEGQGFAFSAEMATWDGRLVLKNFRAQGEGLYLEAEEARWDLEGTLELFIAQGEGAGWKLLFNYGRYSNGLLVAQDVEASGHGLRVRAKLLEFWVEEERLKFREVQIVHNS